MRASNSLKLSLLPLLASPTPHDQVWGRESSGVSLTPLLLRGSQGVRERNDRGSEMQGERWQGRWWVGMGLGTEGKRLVGGGINLPHTGLLMRAWGRGRT